MKPLVLSLLALLGGLPAALAGERAPAPNVGALTLESSPSARFFAFFALAADNRARRDATEYPLHSPASASCNQEPSDSFLRHDLTREPATLEARSAST